MRKILRKKITDIILVGFVDIEDKVAQFYPDYRWIYIECENHMLIEFDASQEYGKLRLREVEEIRYLFDCDEDMYMAKTSVIENVLISSYLDGNIIEDIELINETEIDGILQCDAAKIMLRNNQCIFFDPTFHYGIGIGGMEQEKYWQYCN